MIETGDGLAISAVVWLVALAAILGLSMRSGAITAGLVCAYAIGLWLIHWPGAAIYLLPWYPGVDEPMVEAGFQQSAYGIVAYAVGSLLVAPVLSAAFGRRKAAAEAASGPSSTIGVYSRAYLGLGLACYLTLGAVIGRVPTLTALVSTGWNLVIVGLGLSCWYAWRRGRSTQLLSWLVVVACLPFMTILAQGYLTYGSSACLAVLAMVASFYRPRWHIALAGSLIFLAAFSLYVTYMRDRQSIRQVVWADQPTAARMGQLATTLSALEVFDPHDERHLTLIDDRLNQNRLDGAAVEYLDSGLADFAQGETIRQALSALIPRAIWADKPVSAGSPGIVSQYTGIHFAPNTSVGIGHVMEFYINFGTPGVLVGFLFLGVVVSLIDRAAARRLAGRNWAGFTLWYLPGFNLLQVGGSLVELTASVGAAWITTLLVNALIAHVLTPRPRRDEMRPPVVLPRLGASSG
jgi:hypothetical protein